MARAKDLHHIKLPGSSYVLDFINNFSQYTIGTKATPNSASILLIDMDNSNLTTHDYIVNIDHMAGVFALTGTKGTEYRGTDVTPGEAIISLNTSASTFNCIGRNLSLKGTFNITQAATDDDCCTFSSVKVTSGIDPYVYIFGFFNDHNSSTALTVNASAGLILGSANGCNQCPSFGWINKDEIICSGASGSEIDFQPNYQYHGKLTLASSAKTTLSVGVDVVLGCEISVGSNGVRLCFDGKAKIIENNSTEVKLPSGFMNETINFQRLNFSGSGDLEIYYSGTNYDSATMAALHRALTYSIDDLQTFTRAQVKIAKGKFYDFDGLQETPLTV